MTAIVRKEIEIEAPAERVWTYVGTQAGLQQWWGEEIFLEEAEGGRCEEKGTVAGIPYHRVGRVTLYDPPRQLRLAFQEIGEQVWPAAVSVTLTLVEVNGRTVVTVIQQPHDPSLSPSGAPLSEPFQARSGAQPPVLRSPQAMGVASPGLSGDVSHPNSLPIMSRHGAGTFGERLWQKRLEVLAQTARRHR